MPRPAVVRWNGSRLDVHPRVLGEHAVVRAEAALVAEGPLAEVAAGEADRAADRIERDRVGVGAGGHGTEAREDQDDDAKHATTVGKRGVLDRSPAGPFTSLFSIPGMSRWVVPSYIVRKPARTASMIARRVMRPLTVPSKASRMDSRRRNGAARPPTGRDRGRR